MESSFDNELGPFLCYERFSHICTAADSITLDLLGTARASTDFCELHAVSETAGAWHRPPHTQPGEGKVCGGHSTNVQFHKSSHKPIRKTLSHVPKTREKTLPKTGIINAKRTQRHVTCPAGNTGN